MEKLEFSIQELSLFKENE